MATIFTALVLLRFLLDYLTIKHPKLLYDCIYNFFILAVGVLFVVGYFPILQPDRSGWILIAFAGIFTIIDFFRYSKAKKDTEINRDSL